MSNRTKIIRSVDSTPNHFTPLSNKLLQDNKLSLDTRGLLAFIISLPPDWVVYKENIQKQLGFGRKKMDRIWSEAKKAGYLRVEKFRQTDGTWNYTYTISDVPLSIVPLSNDGSSNVGKGNTIQSNHQQSNHLQSKEGLYKEGVSIDSISTKEPTPSFTELYYKGISAEDYLNKNYKL